MKLTTAVGMKNLQSLKNEDVFKSVLKLDLLLANKKKRYLISGFFFNESWKRYTRLNTKDQLSRRLGKFDLTVNIFYLNLALQC